MSSMIPIAVVMALKYIIKYSPMENAQKMKCEKMCIMAYSMTDEVAFAVP